jgi:hypothetical protein
VTDKRRSAGSRETEGFVLFSLLPFGCEEVFSTVSVLIQYTGFQLKPRGRDYSYRVVGMKSEDREFTLTISNRAFEERHFPYQDGAALCYQKLQKELLAETAEFPLQHHLTISDQDLDEYLAKYRPPRKRSW